MSSKKLQNKITRAKLSYVIAVTLNITHYWIHNAEEINFTFEHPAADKRKRIEDGFVGKKN